MTKQLILADRLAPVREAYIHVINDTDKLYERVRWKYGFHPSDEMLEKHIEQGEMYLYICEEKIVGLMVFLMHQDEDYHGVAWKSKLMDDEVATVHMLAILPEYQGIGYGKAMMQEAREIALSKGKKSIRLDTLYTNEPARHFYHSLGFEDCGEGDGFVENYGILHFHYHELVLS